MTTINENKSRLDLFSKVVNGIIEIFDFLGIFYEEKENQDYTIKRKNDYFNYFCGSFLKDWFDDYSIDMQYLYDEDGEEVREYIRYCDDNGKVHELEKEYLETNDYYEVRLVIAKAIWEKNVEHSFEEIKKEFNLPFVFDEFINNYKAVNEGTLPFVTAFDDNGSNSEDPYFKYEILPYNMNQGRRYKQVNLSEFPIMKGSYVSGVCPIDDEVHSGTVYKILKDGEGEIEWIFILEDKTREFIRLDPDTVNLSTPIPIPSKHLADPFANYKAKIY